MSFILTSEMPHFVLVLQAWKVRLREFDKLIPKQGKCMTIRSECK